MKTLDARRFRLESGGAFGGMTLSGFCLIEELSRFDRLASGATLLADLAGRVLGGRLRPVIGRIENWTKVDDVLRALLHREFTGKAVLRTNRLSRKLDLL